MCRTDSLAAGTPLLRRLSRDHHSYFSHHSYCICVIKHQETGPRIRETPHGRFGPMSALQLLFPWLFALLFPSERIPQFHVENGLVACIELSFNYRG